MCLKGDETMSLPEHKKYTYEEFLEIAKDIERVEFIDGEIYYMSTPSMRHQEILLNLAVELKTFFKDKNCKPIIAPHDVVLKDASGVKRVQPDIFVVCEHNDMDLDKNEFEGIPSLIIEILSPSNAANDLVTKLNLYMRFGVKEYWIVRPKSKSIDVYIYNQELKVYSDYKEYVLDDGIVESRIFNDLSINMNDIF